MITAERPGTQASRDLPAIPERYRPHEPETRDAQWAYLCTARREKVAQALGHATRLVAQCEQRGFTANRAQFATVALALDAAAEKLADSMLPEVAGPVGRELGRALGALCLRLRALGQLVQALEYESSAVGTHGSEERLLRLCDSLLFDAAEAVDTCRALACQWTGEEVPHA